jgi:oxygen-independent coproporphyrinogen-3 oxidase
MLRRYDKPGPRYTSYPTAPYFREDFQAGEFLSEIDRSNAASQPADLSLYFHLPFCDTLCYFCGCTMIITRNRQRIDEYLDYLSKEIELIGSRIKAGRKVTQLHWGGGTPTYLDPDQIRRIFSVIRQHFDFSDDAEISVEIDPRGMTEAHLDALAEVGFNRGSMGVQDFDPKVQEAVNRIQSEPLTRWAFDGLRARGIESINLDLIYGLPFQTKASFEHLLERIIAISPDRLAVFNYAHVPWMKKHQRIIAEDTLPKAEEKLEILKLTIEKLTASGYVFIGMDHFAKPDDSLTRALQEKKLYRNFQGYSTKWGCDLYAMGMSSISQLNDVYAQNIKDVPAYYRSLASGQLATERGYRLNADDHLRRHVITKIMCDFELDKTRIESQYGIDFGEYFADALQQLEPLRADGLVTFSNGRIIVTEAGRLLVRNVAMAFDAYFNKDKTSATPMYSKTV